MGVWGKEGVEGSTLYVGDLYCPVKQPGAVVDQTSTLSVIQITVFGVFYRDGGGAGPEEGRGGRHPLRRRSVFPCKAARWSCWSDIDSFYNGE